MFGYGLHRYEHFFVRQPAALYLVAVPTTYTNVVSMVASRIIFSIKVISLTVTVLVQIKLGPSQKLFAVGALPLLHQINEILIHDRAISAISLTLTEEIIEQGFIGTLSQTRSIIVSRHVFCSIS